jgi:hypothetical protein
MTPESGSRPAGGKGFAPLRRGIALARGAVMMRRGLLLLLVATGCSGSDSLQQEESCDGATAPALDACPVVGPFFASCGGSGPPRLACKDTDCMWFTTSCVAKGFVASECLATNICCQEHGFPYTQDEIEQPSWDALPSLMWQYGTQPWDETRAMNVDVVVDPSLGHAATPGITCTPSGGVATVCDSRNQSIAVNWIAQNDWISFRLGSAIWPAGQVLRVDIDPARRRARVCQAFYTDAIVHQCHSMAVSCAASGTITLPSLPATTQDLPYRIDLQLGPTRIAGGD